MGWSSVEASSECLMTIHQPLCHGKTLKLQHKAPIRLLAVGPMSGEHRKPIESTGQYKANGANPSTGQIGPSTQSHSKLSITPVSTTAHSLPYAMPPQQRLVASRSILAASIGMPRKSLSGLRLHIKFAAMLFNSRVLLDNCFCFALPPAFIQPTGDP